MERPLVSVLIPAYNAEATLGETLTSLLAQTWAPLQIVVVNDGSSDGTLAVARAFEADGVTVVDQGENRGQTATLNRALEELDPEAAFVQFFDADDLMAPDKIEVQVQRLLAEPPGTLATAAWGRLYDGDVSSAQFVPARDNRDYGTPIEWLIDDWTRNGTMPPGSWLYPRSIVEAAGPWNEGLSLNNDMEYFTRAVLAADRIVFCQEARWYYRSGHESLSSGRSRKALESQFEVIRLSTERLLAREDSPRTRHASACYWQTFTFMAYPDALDLVAEAERRIRRLGGGSLQPRGGRAYEALQRMIGWKPAIRLQQAYRRLRSAP